MRAIGPGIGLWCADEGPQSHMGVDTRRRGLPATRSPPPSQSRAGRHDYDRHKSRSVCERYNIVSAGDLAEAARKLDDVAAGTVTSKTAKLAKAMVLSS